MSMLDGARRELAARRHAADETGDWRERSILGPLADVADHVCRIGDHPERGHYRADKAGALLAAAVRLQRETLLGYAGWPEDCAEEATIVDGYALVDDVCRAVGRLAWTAARGARGDRGELYESEARALRDVARRLSRWIDAHTASTVREPRS